MNGSCVKKRMSELRVLSSKRWQVIGPSCTVSHPKALMHSVSTTGSETTKKISAHTNASRTRTNRRASRYAQQQIRSGGTT